MREFFEFVGATVAGALAGLGIVYVALAVFG